MSQVIIMNVDLMLEILFDEAIEDDLEIVDVCNGEEEPELDETEWNDILFESNSLEEFTDKLLRRLRSRYFRVWFDQMREIDNSSEYLRLERELDDANKKWWRYMDEEDHTSDRRRRINEVEDEKFILKQEIKRLEGTYQNSYNVLDEAEQFQWMRLSKFHTFRDVKIKIEE